MGEMIYLWRIARDCPNEWIAIHDKITIDPTFFRSARFFDDQKPVLFSIKKSRLDVEKQSYLPNSAMLPLISEEIGLHLKSIVGGAVQIVPAVISCEDGEVEMSLINILCSKKAVDWNNSDAIYIPGTREVMKFRKLNIISSAVENVNIFRLYEFKSFIATSGRIKNLFSDSRLCEFVYPSEVRP